MSYYDDWEYDIKEFLISFLESDFNQLNIEVFLKKFELTHYEVPDDVKSAKRALLVDGDPDYIISSTDLSWISERTNVLITSSNNRNLIFVDLDSTRDTYYLNSAAFIKVFNKAFPKNNCYIIKTCDGLAVGSMRKFNSIVKFKIQMFYPYVIKRLYEVNCDTSDEGLIKDFAKLESFVVRRKLSIKGTHDYTSKCYSIIKSGIDALVESDLANADSGITDLDIKRYLADTKDDTAKMVLFCIELYRRRDDAMDVNVLEYKYTLEHIMPKKWETHWSSVPIVNGDIVLDMQLEESKQYRKEAIESIGNKTLLTCNLNSSIRNASYDKKISGDGYTKPGYKSHTMLLLTKEIVSLYEVDPTWDENSIVKRAEKLFDEFLILWPSFSETVQSPRVLAQDPESDPDLSKYTKEQLDNPIELLGVL